MKRFKMPTPSLVISMIALFVALGGTSYAAITALPANSVGTPQLKNNAVTGVKIANGAVTAAKINTTGLTVPNATQAANSSKFGTLSPSDFGNRVAWSHTIYFGGTWPQAGQATGSANALTVGTVTIKTGGASGGTQFVSLHGKLGFYTNSAFATYCPSNDFCGWRPELIDDSNGAVLDDAIWRPRADDDANTIPLDAVVAAPAQTTRTYTMKLWYEGTFATGTFASYDYSLTAETSPYGSTGGSTLSQPASAPRTGRSTTH